MKPFSQSGSAQALVHEVDDQAIGNQVARIHVALGLLAELGLVLHRSAQDVARGNVGRGEFLDQLGGRVPLPRPGRPTKRYSFVSPFNLCSGPIVSACART